MSEFWSWYVIVLTLLNIGACWWLLLWTSKGGAKKDEKIETTGHVWDEDLTELNNPLPRWWLYLFYITIFFGLIYLALYPGLGNFKGYLNWSQITAYEQEVKKAEVQYADVYMQFAGQSIEQLSQDENSLKYGQRLFVNNCAVCHGSDGRGAPGFPNLNDNDWLWGGSAEQIKTSISNGRMGVMPPWGAVLGEQGVESMIAYVLSLSGQSLSSELVEEGKTNYTMYCVACHGVDGKGNQMLGSPNLTDKAWLYGNSANALRITIDKGRNGVMPAHNELLSEEQINLVAAYVFGLSVEK